MVERPPVYQITELLGATLQSRPRPEGINKEALFQALGLEVDLMTPEGREAYNSIVPTSLGRRLLGEHPSISDKRELVKARKMLTTFISSVNEVEEPSQEQKEVVEDLLAIFDRHRWLDGERAYPLFSTILSLRRDLLPVEVMQKIQMGLQTQLYRQEAKEVHELAEKLQGFIPFMPKGKAGQTLLFRVQNWSGNVYKEMKNRLDKEFHKVRRLHLQ